MKPACATEEYASIRFMSVWVIPMTEPMIMDAAAMIATTGCHVQAIGCSAEKQTRSIAANAATLVQEAMNAVTGGRCSLVHVGCPQVERADRRLEQQADDDQRDAAEQSRAGGTSDALLLGDGGEPG